MSQFDDPFSKYAAPTDDPFAKYAAPTPKAEVPKLEEFSLPERAAGNAIEAFRGTPLGIALRVPSKPVYERDSKKREANQKAYDEEVRKYKEERKAQLQTYASIPDWHVQKGGEGFTDTLAKLASSATGQIAGSMADPFNLIPLGKGANMLKTFLKGATPNAAYGGMTEYANQTADIELGLRDDYDWDAVIASTAASGAVGGGMNVATNHGRLTSQPKAGDDTAAKMAAMKAMKEQEAAAKAAKEAQVAAAKADVADPFAKYAIETPKPSLAELQGRIMDEPQPDLPTIETFPETHPTTVTPEQAGPLPEIDNVTRLAMQEKAPEQGYPVLDKEFQTTEPVGHPDDMLPSNQMPHVDQAMEFPPIDNHGFGPDVSNDLNPQNPYMPKRLPEVAEGLPGTHEMEIPSIPPVGERNRQRIPKNDGMFENEHLDLSTGRDTSIRTKPEAAQAMAAAKTTGDILSVVAAHGTPDERVLANAILGKSLDHNIPVVHDFDLDARGQINTDVEGGRRITLNPLHSDATTVLHEVTHAHTNDAFNAVAVGRATPEQAAYVANIQKLFDAAKRKMKDANPLWFKDLKEFNAYGLTEPKFREALDKIPYRGETLWKTFVSYVSEFFGVKDPSIFRKLLEGTKEWESIQSSEFFRGANVFDLNLRAERAKRGLTEFESLPGDPPLTKKQQAIADKIAAHHGFFKDTADLAGYLWDNMGRIPELEIKGDLVMQNQLAMMETKNPIPSFVFNHLLEGMRKSEARMIKYDRVSKDIIKWGENNPKETVNFFREWVQLNAKPQLKELRAQLAAGGPDAIRAHFVEKGVSPEAVDKFLPLMDVLKDVHNSDRASLRKSKSRTEDLGEEPLYFPLSRRGPYHVTVKDGTGVIRHAEGFKSLAEAKEFQKDANARKEEGWEVSEVERTDPSRNLNSAMTEALTSGAPEWLRDVATNSFMKRAEYVRKFELGRGTHEVGGYLGQIAPTADKQFKDLANAYLDSFSHRVRESHHLENGASAVELANDLLIDPTLIRDTLPKTFNWMNTVLSRHLGLDVSSLPKVDRRLQAASNKVGRLVTHIDGVMKKYDVNPQDNVFSPELMKSALQAYSYFVSMVKIGLVPHVLAANLIQNVTISLDGARNAMRLGVPLDHVLAAQAKHIAYITTRLLPKDLRPAAFKDIEAKMQKAKDEGVIDPHGREDYTTVENPESRGSVSEQAWNMADKVVQAPRDAIERLTNYNAVLFNHFFVDSAFRSLSPDAKERMVYNLARSFTGDYSQPANLFLYDKAGTLGNLGSNFARWKFNRTSRYLDDLLQLQNTGEVGVRSGLGPIVVSLTLGAVMAGGMGTIGLVEYEAIRRMLSHFEVVDLPPLAALIDKVLPDDLPEGTRTFVERGAVTAFSDHIARSYGQESGPDISTSIRESSFLEFPFVAADYAWDAAVASGVGLKMAVYSAIEKMPDGPQKEMAESVFEKTRMGVTNEETRQVIKAMPVVIQEALKYSKGQTKAIPDVDNWPHGQKYVVPEQKKDTGNFVRDEFQQTLAMMGGLKTTEENRHTEAKSYHRHLNRKAETTLTKLKQGIMDNPGDTALYERNKKKVFEQYGEEAWKRLEAEVKREREEKMMTDYFTLEELAASRKGDEVSKGRAFERLNDAKRVARPRTSSDR
jgi:hypothetical protein